jgi:hypothetical protein
MTRSRGTSRAAQCRAGAERRAGGGTSWRGSGDHLGVRAPACGWRWWSSFGPFRGELALVAGLLVLLLAAANGAITAGPHPENDATSGRRRVAVGEHGAAVAATRGLGALPWILREPGATIWRADARGSDTNGIEVANRPAEFSVCLRRRPDRAHFERRSGAGAERPHAGQNNSGAPLHEERRRATGREQRAECGMRVGCRSLVIASPPAVAGAPRG